MKAETLSFIRHLSPFLDWIYPPRCRYCKAQLFDPGDECFCAACREKIRLVSHPFCPNCGRPYFDGSGDDHLCGACLAGSPYFQQARAWACYPTDELSGHPLREVLQHFKYGRKLSLGKPLGRLMARDCEGLFQGCVFDVIVPIPLHPKRLRWRGFNQALLLAREVGRRWKIAVDPFVLLRSRETQPQTQLDERERRKNVRGAFSGGAPARGRFACLPWRGQSPKGG
ncbi:MAG: ComF family protein [Deltaproteobacteria bacterium]|nr:ComF family protein [Deltaproteobacteria bacterium]